jgi:hypothetical protein
VVMGGGQFARYTFGGTTERFDVIRHNVFAGPLLLFGRKLGPRWQLYTEANVSWGANLRFYNGELYHATSEVKSLHLFGICARYRLN